MVVAPGEIFITPDHRRIINLINETVSAGRRLIKKYDFFSSLQDSYRSLRCQCICVRVLQALECDRYCVFPLSFIP